MTFQCHLKANGVIVPQGDASLQQLAALGHMLVIAGHVSFPLSLLKDENIPFRTVTLTAGAKLVVAPDSVVMFQCTISAVLLSSATFDHHNVVQSESFIRRQLNFVPEVVKAMGGGDGNFIRLGQVLYPDSKKHASAVVRQLLSESLDYPSVTQLIAGLAERENSMRH